MQLSIRATCGKSWRAFLQRKVLAAGALLLQQAPDEVSIALVGDITMGRLHERYMGIAGPTDVLTFELDRDRRGRITSGEIILCIPHARRAARRLGTNPKHEALLYAIHGLLHLCGFDDRTEHDFRVMHAKEDDILTRLGVGPVFHRTTPRRRRNVNP